MSKKNRDLNELQDSIDREYSLRISELSFLKEKLYPFSHLESKIYARTLIILLYAHWEGFIKNISQYYIQYIYHQNHLSKELTYGLVTISNLKELNSYIESKVSLKIKSLRTILENFDSKAQIPYDYIIATYSNLNTDVLTEICLIIGIDEKKYSLKKGIIDQQLLKNRNDLAHGELISIDPKEAEEIYDKIINIINEFKNDVLNYASMKKYLLANNK